MTHLRLGTASDGSTRVAFSPTLLAVVVVLAPVAVPAAIAAAVAERVAGWAP